MTSNLSDPLETQGGASRLGWTPLMNALPQGVILVNARGRYLEVNPVAARILGMDRETLLSCSLPEPWSNLSAADGSALAPEAFPGLIVLRTGMPLRRKTIGWNREDGSILWLEVSAERLQGGGVLVNFDDITEHRVQSRKVDRLTELYSALSQVNQAIVRSPTKEALLDKICKVMVEFGKFAIAWIAWNDSETQEVGVISQFGDKNGDLDSLLVRSDETALGRGGTGTAIREGHPCVVNDLLGSPSASPWHDAAIRAGIASSASIPIRKGGKVCGALVMYATEKDYFGVLETKLLEEIAGDISFALGHYGLEAQHNQDEELLKVNERKYRSLFETMTEGVVLHELVENGNGEIQDYRILDANQSFQRHTGLDPVSARGRLASELYGAPVPPYLEEYTRVALTGEPYAFETFFPPLGKHFRISVFSTNPGQFATVFEDITQQRENEDLLQDTLQRLELAMTSSSMGVWDWDLLSGSMIWDDRMFELYGASHGEIQGTVQDWKDGLHPEDLDRAIAECEAAIKGEAPFDTEFRVKHRNGNILWIKANAVVLRDQHGKPVRMIGLNHDITEQRNVQEQIRRLNMDLEERVKERTAQLESANKEMEAFSYSVSHDLRAPLRSIDGFCQVLLEDYQNQVDETGKHYLRRIRAGTQRMGTLIADLLKLSKTSRSEMVLADCDLSRLSGEIANGLSMANAPRKVEITIQPGMMVQADHHLMQVVLDNLLGNAWKFTSKCQAPRIEVGQIASPGEERTFFIRDNGAGFDMAHAYKLFNAFQRLHSTSDFEGTGIGLAIVQRIISRHGGRVWAEAEVGKGATFFFTLPD